MKLGALLLFVLAAAVAAITGFLLGSAYALGHLATISDPQAILITGFIAAALAIGTAAVALWGVYSQRVLARRQATIAHIAALDGDKSVQDRIHDFIALTRGQQNLAHHADEDKVGTPEQLTIIAVLNQFELISTGIQRGIFEYELIRQWQANSIMRYWTAAHPFVVALRQRVGINTLWQEFEKLNGWVSGQSSPFSALWWTGLG